MFTMVPQVYLCLTFATFFAYSHIILNCFPFQQLANFSSLFQFLHINEHDRPISPFRAYSHQRRAFFSAAEILLRLYQSPIHFNEARWRKTFFRRRTSRCLQNLVR